MTNLCLLLALVVVGLAIPGGLSAAEVCPINNCATCKTPTTAETCSACKPGYVTAPDKSCIACPEHCETCTLYGLASNCTTCSKGFFLKGGDCAACTQGCEICTSYGSCTSCSTGQIALTVQTCKACPSDCTTCDGPGKCRVCDEGYYLNAAYLCPPCLTDCKTCTTGTGCDTCKDEHYWKAEDKSCDDCESNCKTCNDDKTCTVCASGYFLKAGDCLSCSNCPTDKCKSGTGCEECNVGYFKNPDGTCCDCPYNELDDSKIKCESCLSKTLNFGGRFKDGGVCEYCLLNCKNCSSTTACLECNDGFYKNGSNHCLECHASCATCSGPADTECTKCLDATKFTTGSAACADCNATCATCSAPSGDKCTTCKPGNYLDGSAPNKCKLCTDVPSPQYMNEIQCTSCKPNHVYQDQCIKCDLGCRLCNEAKECSKCRDGYFKAGTTCTACHESCANGTCTGATGGACTTCNATTEEKISTGCVDNCENGDYRDGDNCKNCTLTFGSDCSTCDSAGCKTCNGGKHLKANRKDCIDCTTISDKASCKEGCFWNDTSSSCAPCNDTCKECTDFNSNGIADANECTSCVSGTPKSNECYECHTTCATCNGPANTDCVICKDGKNFKDGTCQDCTESDCTKCSMDIDVCEACSNSKVVFNTKCVACDNAVKETQGYCNQCKFLATGFYGFARSQTCAKCGKHCLTCSTANKCDADKCEKGFVYESSDQTCRGADCSNPKTEYECETECPPTGRHNQWKSSTSKCILCPENCDGCNDNGICSDCADEYVLNADNVCKKCYGDESMCTQCGTATTGRFYSQTGKQCRSCISKCLECADATTCKAGKCYTKNYYKSSDKQCTACKAECDVCSESNSLEVCSQCSAGSYYKDANSTCKACSSRCKTCSDPTGTCTVCDDRYYKDTNNTCKACPTSCAECTASACTKCDGNRYYNSTTKKCEDCAMTNCKECNINTGTCTACNNEFKLVNNSICSACPTGCSVCNGAKTCDSQKCYGCDTCKTLVGTFIAATTGECKACTVADNNCAVCNMSDKGTCNSDGCTVGHYFDGTSAMKCVVCPTTCATCTSTTATKTKTSCLTCNVGHCLLHDAATTLDSCEPYSTNAKDCKTCKKVNTKLTCITCDANKALEICGACDVANCIDCKADKTKCDKSKCIANSYASTTNTECKQCTLSTVVGDECKDSCDATVRRVWDSTKKQCDPCDDTNCLVCSPKDKCTKCKHGYYATSKDTCGPCLLHCTACTTSKDCATCGSGYRKVTETDGRVKCEKCQVDDCVNCNSNVAKCDTCSSGHYYKKSDYKCHDCTSDDCDVCTEDGVCTKCKGGHYVRGSGCADCKLDGCNSCKDFPIACETCKSPYTNKDNPNKCQKECYVCDNCLKPDSSNIKSCPDATHLCQIERIVLKKKGFQFNRKCQAPSTCIKPYGNNCDDKSCCEGAKCNAKDCSSSAPGVRTQLFSAVGLLSLLVTLGVYM